MPRKIATICLTPLKCCMNLYTPYKIGLWEQVDIKKVMPRQYATYCLTSLKCCINLYIHKNRKQV